MPTVKGSNARKGNIGLSRPAPGPGPLLSPTSARLPMLWAWPPPAAGPRTRKQTTWGEREQTPLNDTPKDQQHSSIGHVSLPSFTLPWVPPGLDEQSSHTSPSTSIPVSSSPLASQLTPNFVARRLSGAFADRLQMTISALSDDVLLEIFDFYLDRTGRVDAWHILSHVCQQWRWVVFASPQRLNLRLLCTPKRRAMMTLDIWPAIPIVIDFVVIQKLPQDMGNIIAALKQQNRVSKIKIHNIPNSLLKQFAVMKPPFPALTKLNISSHDQVAPLVLYSFLGGSMPQLRSLRLTGIAFAALPKLLLSTGDLVDLRLWRIPHSGYISPEAMGTGLSSLSRLRKLVLEFRFPRARDDRATRHVPPLTRAVLPSLTTLKFEGESEYLEDMLSRIDAPLLDCINITFFNQVMFDTPLLGHFISRTETFTAVHRAEVIFRTLGVQITLVRKNGTFNNETLTLLILCKPSDWQLSSIAQVCNTIIPPLPTLGKLSIDEGPVQRLQWYDDMENTQWLELLRSFTRVKTLLLSRILVRLVAPALQELAGERLTEVLPMLQYLLIEGPPPSGSVNNSIYKFLTTRQDSSCPVRLRGVGQVADDGLC